MLGKILVLLLPVTLAWFVAMFKGGGVGDYVELLSYFLLFCVVFIVSYHWDSNILLIFVLVAMINIFLGFYGLYSYYNLTIYKYRLVYTSQVNPSWFAASLSGSLFGLIFIATQKRLFKKGKLMLAIMAMLLLIFLILTQTLNSIIAMIFGLIAFGYARSKNPFKLVQNIFFLGVVLYLVVQVFTTMLDLPEIQISKIETIEGGDANTISSGRIGRWEVFLSEPITFFGNGLRFGVQSLTNEFYTQGDPHNSFISIYFEMGLFGLLLFLSSIIYLFRWFTKYRVKMPVVFGFYVYLIFSCLGNDVFYYKYFWINLSLLSMMISYHFSPFYERSRILK
jgi:O-antigen ligase